MKYSDWFRRNEAAQGRAPQSPEPAAATAPIELGDSAAARHERDVFPGLRRFVRAGTAAQEAVSRLTADKNHYVNYDPAPRAAPPPITEGEPMEPATAIRPESEPPLPPPKATRLRRSLPEIRRILAMAAASPLDLRAFCEESGVSSSLIYKWRRQGIKPAATATLGNDGAPGRRRPGRPKGSSGMTTTLQQRRFHVGQAFAAGSDPVEYAREQGISIANLNRWRRQCGAPVAEGTLVDQRQDTQADALHSALEDLRLENTVLKAALQLAERRGFNLLAIGQQLSRGGKRR